MIPPSSSPRCRLRPFSGGLVLVATCTLAHCHSAAGRLRPFSGGPGERSGRGGQFPPRGTQHACWGGRGGRSDQRCLPSPEPARRRCPRRAGPAPARPGRAIARPLRAPPPLDVAATKEKRRAREKLRSAGLDNRRGRHDININFRKFARIFWIGATPTPPLARPARQGGWGAAPIPKICADL